MIRAFILACSLALTAIWFVPTNTTLTAVSQFPHPWSGACKVKVILRAGFASGGSGTLIGVTEKEALVLTVSHVAERVGQTAICQFGNVEVRGYVLATHPTADLALIVVQRPAGIQPVPVTHATSKTGPYYLAGFPGYDRNTLRYQRGDYVEHDDDTLTVTCKPEKGMSGGPAYDRYGRVVGAISAYGIKYGYVGDGDALRDLVRPYLR